MSSKKGAKRPIEKEESSDEAPDAVAFDKGKEKALDEKRRERLAKLQCALLHFIIYIHIILY